MGSSQKGLREGGGKIYQWQAAGSEAGRRALNPFGELVSQGVEAPKALRRPHARERILPVTVSSSAKLKKAVAAWQHHQFVYRSMQQTQEARRFAEVLSRNEGKAMRIFMAFAITMAAAIGLGGCFWHHQAAVVTQPAPPLK